MISFSISYKWQNKNSVNYSNVGSNKLFELLFWGWIVDSDLHLFQYTVLLNPNYSCSKCFLWFSVDKVTIGTYSFASVVWHSNPDGATIAGGSLLFPASLSFISDKHNFETMLKSIIFHIESMVYLKFSKNCLNVLMTQQFQFHLHQLCFHYNHHKQPQDY